MVRQIKPTRKYPGYPAWDLIACGCCAGLEWGGEYPRECNDCNGTGSYARHRRTGVLAEWPGGRLLGRDSKGITPAEHKALAKAACPCKCKTPLLGYRIKDKTLVVRCRLCNSEAVVRLC